MLERFQQEREKLENHLIDQETFDKWVEHECDYHAVERLRTKPDREKQDMTGASREYKLGLENYMSHIRANMYPPCYKKKNPGSHE